MAETMTIAGKVIKEMMKNILLLALLFLVACGDKDNNKNPISPPISPVEPEISDLSVEVNPGEAIITWKTSVASSPKLRYGPCPTYGSIIPLQWGLDHRVELKGLSPGSCYSAQVDEKDSFTFTTPSEGLRIGMVPALKQVKKGQEFVVELKVAEASSLFGAAIRINFDGSFLEAVRTKPGEFLGSDILYIDKSETSTVGLGLTMKKGNTGATGSGVIGRIVFVAASEGTAELKIDREDLRLTDSEGKPISGFNEISVGGAQIIVEK
ncbi:MAG: cohesin domain-containing protein [bacterium]|nr:cohesin domain-containing protein [bacterium]